MNRNEIYKKVFDALSQKRANAQLVAEINKTRAEQNKEYANLLAKERMLTMQIGKLKFEGRNISKVQKELNDVIAQKNKVLKLIGLTADDLLPKYECEKCHDTGLVENSYCSCVMQMYNNLIMSDCGIDLSTIPSFKDYDFKFFSSEKEIDFAKKCVSTLNDYVNNLSSIKCKNVVMCGGSGTGKTYLAKCIAKELLLRNNTTLFISSFDLNNMFLEEHLSQADKKSHLKDLIDLDVLIIDDLGTEPVRKNVTKEYLLLLLNERLTKEKSTIITTNLLPANVLDRYDERIFSRIFNKRNTLILQFVGDNNRLKK